VERRALVGEGKPVGGQGLALAVVNFARVRELLTVCNFNRD
jgi:hypothetical protein